MWGAGVVVLVVAMGQAAAEPSRVALGPAVRPALPGRAGGVASAPSPAPSGGHANFVYVEAFGRGGAYGIGYERAITPGLALGIAGSFAVLGGHQLYTVAPYLHARLAGGRRHSLVGQVGLAVVHSRLPSPVPEWDGLVETGAGGQATVGWQWQRRRVVTRASGGLAAGEGGVAPFLGLAVGVRL